MCLTSLEGVERLFLLPVSVSICFLLLLKFSIQESDLLLLVCQLFLRVLHHLFNLFNVDHRFDVGFLRLLGERDGVFGRVNSHPNVLFVNNSTADHLEILLVLAFQTLDLLPQFSDLSFEFALDVAQFRRL